MLSRSSIFLKLMGTFYEQIGSTDFMRSFDIGYSSVLLSRYAEIMSTTILSNGLSNIFSSIRFGYINPLEIDVPSRKIIIRDIESNVVIHADFISLSFYNADTAYAVTNTDDSMFVDVEAIMDMSDNGYTGSIPVLYGTSGAPSMVIAEWIVANNDISDYIVKELMPLTLESLARYSLYRDSSRNTIDVISNVLLGAVYAKTWETIIRIDEYTVYTNLTEYKIDGVNEGRVVVSVGDELEPFSLITQVSAISTDVGLIEDVNSMSAYAAATGLPTSNIIYLSRLSEAITKRSVVIDVPPDVITPENVDILSVISGAVGVSNSTETIINSFIVDSSMIDILSSCKNMHTDINEVNIISSGKWILSIPGQGIDVEITDEDRMLLVDAEDNATIGAAVEYEDAIIHTGDSIHPSEKSIMMVENLLSLDIEESDSSEGIYVETVIATVEEEDELLYVVEDSASFGEIEDGSQITEIKDATISISDVFTGEESKASKILYKKIMSVMVSDSILTFTESIDYFSLQDDGFFSVDILVEETIGIDFIDESLFSMDENISISDSEKIELKEYFNIYIVEGIESSAGISVEDSLSIGDSNKYSLDISETIFITDSSDVESDVEIDN